MPDRLTRMTPEEAKSLLDRAFDTQARETLQVEVLARISTQLETLTEQTATMTLTLADTRERVIKVEAENAAFADLSQRVRALEDERQRRDGARGFREWALRNWQGLGFYAIALALAIRYIFTHAS